MSNWYNTTTQRTCILSYKTMDVQCKQESTGMCVADEINQEPMIWCLVLCVCVKGVSTLMVGVYGGRDDDSGLVWRGIIVVNEVGGGHKICSSVSSVGRASVS